MRTEYLSYRNAARELNSQLIKMINRHELELAAQSLGLLVRGIMVFDSEDESSVLMDRAIYDLRRGDKNILACFIEAHSPGDFSETERRLLEGKSKAWFSLFGINEVNPAENSLQLEDLIKKTGPFKLIDIGLSQTVPPGRLLATRLVPIDDWYMTSGVSFPFMPYRAAELLAGLKQRRHSSKKRKYKIIPSEDYSSYFFREFKRLGEAEIRYQNV